jgi:hypothetical protein
MAEKIAWLFFRILRLGLWLAAIAYYTEFAVNRERHLNSFGHLFPSTEFWMFVLPVAAVFVGYLELMMRERAGLSRPAVGRNWTG